MPYYLQLNASSVDPIDGAEIFESSESMVSNDLDELAKALLEWGAKCEKAGFTPTAELISPEEWDAINQEANAAPFTDEQMRDWINSSMAELENGWSSVGVFTPESVAF